VEARTIQNESSGITVIQSPGSMGWDTPFHPLAAETLILHSTGCTPPSREDEQHTATTWRGKNAKKEESNPCMSPSPVS